MKVPHPLSLLHKLQSVRAQHSDIMAAMLHTVSPSLRLQGQRRGRQTACRPVPFSGSRLPRHAAASVPACVAAAQQATVAATPSLASPVAHAGSSAAQGNPTQDVVAVLRSRGLVQEVTSEELGRACAAGPLSVYCGFDPTADSLHLGNLLGIVVLAWFQRCGHEPVALLGGATGRVGDPSGRSTERPVLTEDQIEGNVRAIGRTLESILQRSSASVSGAPKVRSSAGLCRPLQNPPTSCCSRQHCTAPSSHASPSNCSAACVGQFLQLLHAPLPSARVP